MDARDPFRAPFSCTSESHSSRSNSVINDLSYNDHLSHWCRGDNGKRSVKNHAMEMANYLLYSESIFPSAQQNCLVWFVGVCLQGYKHKTHTTIFFLLLFCSVSFVFLISLFFYYRFRVLYLETRLFVYGFGGKERGRRRALLKQKYHFVLTLEPFSQKTTIRTCVVRWLKVKFCVYPIQSQCYCCQHFPHACCF